jgi:hypothetical protein
MDLEMDVVDDVLEMVENIHVDFRDQAVVQLKSSDDNKHLNEMIK